VDLLEVRGARVDFGEPADGVLRGLLEQDLPLTQRLLSDGGESTAPGLQEFIDEGTLEWCHGILEGGFGPFTHDDLRAAEETKDSDDTPAAASTAHDRQAPDKKILACVRQRLQAQALQRIAGAAQAGCVAPEVRLPESLPAQKGPAC
jgi:hypothetical protein